MPQLRSGVRRPRPAAPSPPPPPPPKPATRGRPRTRLAAAKNINKSSQEEDPPLLLQPDTFVVEPPKENIVIEEEAVGVMGDERVGLSANKDKAVAAVPEEDANSPPLPERVQVGGSPLYKVERKLGKGGFGQVFVGRRERANAPGAVEVALKFEHRNSKGCNYGPPYEWQVYK
ncbi:casein kinase, putative [Medicago truncatula]|uniref:Casein kinase, putative n=1 Tax=Medicago truncatula TaxID=3880 RepID=A0A072VRA8_MEDTR|nr:casein kinase, putative [Medicago truncatula]